MSSPAARARKGRIPVCHIITGFDTGGAERVLLQTVARLNSQTFSSVIVSLRKRGALSPSVDRTGIETIYLGMGRRPGPGTLWRLIRLLRSRRIQVVHTYLFDASIVGRVAAWLAGVPVVLSSTRSSLEYLPRLALWVDRITAVLCQRVIAVSRGTADFVIQQERIPAAKVVVVSNGVDLEHYQPGDRASARAMLGINRTSCVVASIGRLHTQKGHRFLLKALSLLRTEMPSLVCVIAGDGELRDELEEYARIVGVENCCRFLGVVPDSRIVYDAADLLVLSSLYEGMPNVVLEAMAMAIPVVATKVQGAVELVREGETGFLVPPADEHALATSIRRLAVDPQRARAMGLRGREIVEQSHGIDAMVNTVEELYQRELVRSGAFSDDEDTNSR